MKLPIFIFFVVLVFGALSCDSQDEYSSETEEATLVSEVFPETSTLPIVQDIEEAHKANLFHQKEAISFDIILSFRGSVRLKGTITSATNSSGIRIDREDGSVIAYDGQKVWLAPADARVGGARFDIFTWQYFFMAPYKLSDPGTNWEELEDKIIDGESHSAAKLTFDVGTGDAPDDWYIAFKNKNSKLLDALAYIVTFRASREEAEEEPHAISYHNYQEVEGVPIATEWKFWLWTEERGLFDQLGEATISNVRFVDVENDTFAAPVDSQTVSR